MTFSTKKLTFSTKNYIFNKKIDIFSLTTHTHTRTTMEQQVKFLNRLVDPASIPFPKNKELGSTRSFYGIHITRMRYSHHFEFAKYFSICNTSITTLDNIQLYKMTRLVDLNISGNPKLKFLNRKTVRAINGSKKLQFLTMDHETYNNTKSKIKIKKTIKLYLV